MPMTQTERERQHRVRMTQIDAVQVIAGRGEHAKVNHERTLIERARLLAEEIASHRATERGLEALDRLLHAAHELESPCKREIGQFIESVWNNKPMSLMVLRGIDKRVADDMLDVLDAWRWARVNLAEHVKGGPRRVAVTLRACRA